MTRDETAELLGLCAAYDQRATSDTEIAAWHEALNSPWVPDISLDEAHAVVVAHYRDASQRITPADILGRVKDDRMRGVPAAFPVRSGVPPTEEARAELDARLGRKKPEGAA